jgi:NAD(P)-dependent dehydrogenase (short-subunit alcohol dehydrogenase family)
MSSRPASGIAGTTRAPLAGKLAIVTGGGRGLGSAISHGLAADGAVVDVWFHADATSANRVVEQIQSGGGTATSRQIDVNSRDEVTAAVQSIVENRGHIDILVNNAGIMRRAPFLEITDADWNEVISTNLTGYFVVGQVVARVMSQQGFGSIVNVSSTNDLIASVNCTPYAAAKGGVGMLTKQMSLELGGAGVRVNAVAPGMVETDLNREQLSEPSFRREAMSRIPLGRFVQSSDVADAVRYLASDQSRSVSGATIRVDAGRTVS